MLAEKPMSTANEQQKTPSPISFNVDELIEKATRFSGLTDFGALPYREGLQALADTYDRLVKDPVGRKKCRERLINLLSTRLRWEAALKRQPDIHDQAITAPIFVTGLPRSGTSALLNLLARKFHK